MTSLTFDIESDLALDGSLIRHIHVTGVDGLIIVASGLDVDALVGLGHVQRLLNGCGCLMCAVDRLTVACPPQDGHVVAGEEWRAVDGCLLTFHQVRSSLCLALGSLCTSSQYWPWRYLTGKLTDWMKVTRLLVQIIVKYINITWHTDKVKPVGAASCIGVVDAAKTDVLASHVSGRVGYG